MNISFAIIIVYMALLIGISLLSGRLSSARGGSSSFLLAGNRLPTLLVAAMVAGTAIGGYHRYCRECLHQWPFSRLVQYCLDHWNSGFCLSHV